MTDQHITPTLDLDPATPEQNDAVAEAVAILDASLARMMQRELVSSGEVADLLLDLRTLLTNR